MNTSVEILSRKEVKKIVEDAIRRKTQHLTQELERLRRMIINK